MPNHELNDPITDQEIAFARQVLSGTMTDRQAAQAVGLNPESAAHIKAKPNVRAYMSQHRAAVQQQAEGLQRFHLERDQVLKRLWEIANLSPETTRNSITGQVKALSIIVAMENLIPDRRAVKAEQSVTPDHNRPKIYQAAWLAGRQAMSDEPEQYPAPAEKQDSPVEPGPVPNSGKAAPPNSGHADAATHVSPCQTPPPAPQVSNMTRVPEATGPYFPGRNPISRRR
jgi:hypothetical protein